MQLQPFDSQGAGFKPLLVTIPFILQGPPPQEGLSFQFSASSLFFRLPSLIDLSYTTLRLSTNVFRSYQSSTTALRMHLPLSCLPDIDEYRLKYRTLLNGLRQVETSFMMPAPTGDGGDSIGPLQIRHES